MGKSERRLRPAHLSVSGLLITVEEGDHREALKNTPNSKYNIAAGQWEFLGSPNEAFRLFRHFGKVGVNIEADPLFWQMLERADGVNAPTPQKVVPGTPSKTKSWAHQIEAVEFAKDLPGVMLAMDMGTGKSKVAIDLCNLNRHKKILILCPKSVLRVWPREFESHSLMDYDVRILDQTSVQKKTDAARLFVSAMLVREQPFALVINHESSWRFPFGDNIKKDMRGRIVDITKGFVSEVEWDCIIVDESHRAKSPTGKFSQSLATLNAKQIMALTGTPMPHSPLDIFAQMRFVEPSLFGRSWHWFKKRYAILGGFEGKQIVGVQHEAELNERFFSRAFRVTADEALDLPGTLWTSHFCDLNPKARKIYDELESAFYSAVAEGEITASNALVKLVRLHQIASGHIVFDDEGDTKRPPETISLHKQEALEDILADLNEPVVCFARFTADLVAVEAAAKKLEKSYGEVSGRRKDLDDQAMFPAGIDVLGVNIQSGGVGVDLTRARVAIYVSCGFSLGDFEQSAKRLDRPGQSRKVLYIRLITTHTIDETIYHALAARKNAVEAVLEVKRDGNDV